MPLLITHSHDKIVITSPLIDGAIHRQHDWFPTISKISKSVCISTAEASAPKKLPGQKTKSRSLVEPTSTLASTTKRFSPLHVLRASVLGNTQGQKDLSVL